MEHSLHTAHNLYLSIDLAMVDAKLPLDQMASSGTWW